MLLQKPLFAPATTINEVEESLPLKVQKVRKIQGPVLKATLLKIYPLATLPKFKSRSPVPSPRIIRHYLYLEK